MNLLVKVLAALCVVIFCGYAQQVFPPASGSGTVVCGGAITNNCTPQTNVNGNLAMGTTAPDIVPGRLTLFPTIYPLDQFKVYGSYRIGTSGFRYLTQIGNGLVGAQPEIKTNGSITLNGFDSGDPVPSICVTANPADDHCGYGLAIKQDTDAPLVLLQLSTNTVAGGTVDAKQPFLIGFNHAGAKLWDLDNAGNLHVPSVTITLNQLLLAPTDFADVAWGGTGVTKLSGQTDPIGGTTAFKLTGALADSYISQYVVAPPIAQYAGGVWLKGDSSGTVNLQLMCAPSYVACGGGSISYTTTWTWFQFAGVTPGNTTTVGLLIGGSSSFGLGEVIYAWHPHLNSGTYVLPPI